MRFQREVVSVEEAQQRIMRHARLLPAERVPLIGSYGRTLAEPVTADHPVPHFRRSGVDGYAVAAADTAEAGPDRPVRLRVIDCVPSGSVPSRPVVRGTATRIMTGAAVPDGADAIVMLEMTDRLTDDTIGGEVAVRKRMAAGDNITPVGFEAFHGERVLEAGTVIRPGEAALLATFGYAEVSVHRPPRVAIFPTGSELLSVKDPIAPGKIRNSNGYMLAAQIRECGGEPILMPPLPDWVDEVKEALEQAFEFADVIVTTGGVSVGDKDVLVDYFSGWDGELLFNKVAMRPGSPTTAGVRRDKLLFSLSGNPGAAFVGFELFAAPYVRRLLGQTERPDRVCSGTLEFDYAKGSAYPRYVRGTTSCRDGRLFVTPAGVDKSSIMMTIKDADCLICIPAGGRGAAYGELVRVIRL